MFKNAFANLQKVGKSLMLPVSVLPIAGILLGVGSANFSWLPAVVSHVMAEAGGSVFANMPLIFAIGVALGFTNNDGVSALAAVVAYGIMVKTMAVVAPLVLHLPAALWKVATSLTVFLAITATRCAVLQAITHSRSTPFSGMNMARLPFIVTI
jgi:phosphotransferase system  glucose/maltose/N-acetylglucosamine-specific IIC component